MKTLGLRFFRWLGVLAILCLPGLARAGDWGIDLHAGTLGGGAEVNYTISPYFMARLRANRYNYDYSGRKEQIYYDFTLHLKSYALLLDWHPFAGVFHVTAGYFSNKNDVFGYAQPQNGSYIINGNTYNASQVGNLTGSITFNPGAPYLGIGWNSLGTTSTGFGFEFDLGALFQGSPTAQLSASGSISSNPQFRSDLAQEQAKLQNDVNFFKIYPVVNVGLSYRF
jgi:hypothetical protein